MAVWRTGWLRSPGTLATRIVQLRPRDPESKGIVENRNGYFETSFLPGRAFTSPADFNTQFTGWLDRANSRVVRTTRACPADLIEADRAVMLPLPAIPPKLGWQHQGRDYRHPAGHNIEWQPCCRWSRLSAQQETAWRQGCRDGGVRGRVLRPPRTRTSTPRRSSTCAGC